MLIISFFISFILEIGYLLCIGSEDSLNLLSVFQKCRFLKIIFLIICFILEIFKLFYVYLVFYPLEFYFILFF